MASQCAKCSKTVYKAEELKCLDKVSVYAYSSSSKLAYVPHKP